MSGFARLVRRFGAATLVAAFVPTAAFAGGFEVRPLAVESGDGTGALTVSNPGERRTYVEASIFRWTNGADGADVLESAPDAVVSPPAIWLEAEAEYRFRFKVPKADPGAEGTWRVVFTQVPSRDDLVSGHIVFAISQSVPIFAEPDSLKPPSLSARLLAPDRVAIRNDGGRRLRIAHLVQDGQVLVAGLAGYVLGGSTLVLKLAAPAHSGRIEATTDLGARWIDVRE